MLWLWRAHNRVNWRLNQSGSEAVGQLGLLKMQFPGTARCPGCRAPSGKWRELSLLRHLRASYCIEARPGGPCQGTSSLRLDKREESVLPLPAVAAVCLVAAVLIALHRRAGRAKSCEPKVMTPVNDYSWDGERTGITSTLPLLQRKV